MLEKSPLGPFLAWMKNISFEFADILNSAFSSFGSIIISSPRVKSLIQTKSSLLAIVGGADGLRSLIKPPIVPPTKANRGPAQGATELAAKRPNAIPAEGTRPAACGNNDRKNSPTVSLLLSEGMFSSPQRINTSEFDPPYSSCL